MLGWHSGNSTAPATPAGDEEMTFSIFNQQGENIEGELFDTAKQAQTFMDATDYVTEYGPVHVGQNCESHDEGEAGSCPYCKPPQPAAPQEGQQAKPQSKVGQYISCQTCHKPAGDQATKESGTCHDCRQAIIMAGHAREADKDYGANNTTNTGQDGLLPALS
jgi:hypothetical protein